jgi:predicted nucleic acid-binding protein
MGLIALDTPLFIYLIERHPTYFPLVQPLFKELDDPDSDLWGVTSVVTLLEVLVHPLRHNRQDLVEQYLERLLASPDALTVLPVTPEIAQQAAALRAKYQSLKTPDAIQLATALFAHADAFHTNDNRLNRVTEIPLIVLPPASPPLES